MKWIFVFLFAITVAASFIFIVLPQLPEVPSASNLSLRALIAEGCGGSCDDSEPPERPQCPFSPQEDRIIVNFTDTSKIRSDRDLSRAQTEKASISIPAGDYKVSLASWDGYIGRENASQPHEQWEVVIEDSSSNELVRSNPIQDLEDLVREAFEQGVVNNSLVIPEGGAKVFGEHAVFPDDSSPNSLHPICAVFDTNAPSGPATIRAAKVVCELESELPNWGKGGPNITVSTAQDWVDSHESCEFASGWSFQWVTNDEKSDPGDTLIGEADGAWTTFGPTDGTGVATVELDENDIDGNDLIWFREVLQEEYIPFTHGAHPDNSDNVSAEFYCHTDVLNYDNFDFVKNIALDEIFYCVAFNVLEKEEIPDQMCTDHGFDFSIEKWEWNDSAYQAANDSTEYSIDVTGDAEKALWTASPDVDGVLAKAATAFAVTSGGSEGMVSKSDIGNGMHDISHITFCGNNFVPPPPAPTCTLEADPDLINPGDLVTLSWTSQHASSGSIDNEVGSTNPVQEGSIEIFPDVNITYTATFAGEGGEVTCETSVAVLEEVFPICELVIDPNSIDEGGSAILSWTSENVDEGSIDNSIGTITPPEAGSVTISPLDDTTYVATFAGSHGEAMCSAEITVETGGGGGGGGGPNPPLCTLELDKSSIQSGGTAVLSWTSSNADEGFVSPDIGTTTPVSSGSFSVSPIENTTYTGTFTGPEGEAVCEASIVVETGGGNGSDLSCTLNAEPASVSAGDNSLLSWTTTDADSVSIEPGLGSVDLDGNFNVDPENTTTYTLTASNSETEEEVTCETTVTTGGRGGGGGGGGGSSIRPNVTLTSEVVPGEVLSFVTLSQVPYTGFPTGPLGMTLFWVFLIIWSGILSYFITVRGWGRKWLDSISGTNIPYGFEEEYGRSNIEAINEQTLTAPAQMHISQKEESVEHATVGQAGATASPHDVVRHALEERAYEAGVLLSDEALTHIIVRGNDNLRLAVAVLSEVVERARATYPREDGWIHLNKERVMDLLGENIVEAKVTKDNLSATLPREETLRESQKVSGVSAEVAAPLNLPTGSSTAAQTASIDLEADGSDPVPVFIGWITEGQMDKVFGFLRTLKAQGKSSTKFLTRVICELDDTYQYRLEGEREARGYTVESVKRFSDRDVEQVIEYLLTGVDHSYSTSHTGVKMALLRALTFTEDKRKQA